MGVFSDRDEYPLARLLKMMRDQVWMIERLSTELGNRLAELEIINLDEWTQRMAREAEAYGDRPPEDL